MKRSACVVAFSMVLVLACSALQVKAHNEVDFVADIDTWPDIDNDFITDIVITSDGRHVYAAAYRDRSVAHFIRDPQFGRLEFVEKTLVNAGDTKRLVLSPDEGQLYVLSQFKGRIEALYRDVETGRLTRDSSLTQVGLWSPRALAISPDGLHLYAASVGDVYPQPGSGLTAFVRNPADGVLTQIAKYLDGHDGIEGLHELSRILVSPDGAYVYALSRGDRSVAVFGRDATTGLLTFREVATEGLDDLSELGGEPSAALSPDGRSLYVLVNYPGKLVVFDRDASSGSLTLRRVYSNATPEFERLRFGEDIVVTPDGRAVYVFGTGVVQMVRDPQSGELTSTSKTTPDCAPQFGPAVVSPDGLQLITSHRNGRPTQSGVSATVAVLRINDPAAPPLCESTPRPGCVAAGRARLDLRTGDDPARNRLRWDWRGTVDESPAGPIERGPTEHAICIYVDDGVQPALAASALANVGYGCLPRPWKRTRTALTYSTPSFLRQPGELQRIKLSGEAGGAAKIQVDGDGPLLEVPRLPLPGDARVLVQLVTPEGDCWESDFPAPTRNTAEKYRAEVR